MSFAVLTASLPERASLLEECRASVAALTLPADHLVGIDAQRRGPALIRNDLAASSDADWLLPLDDDDLIDPNYLQVLATHLDGADIVYPWCRVEGREMWSPNRLYRPDTLLRFNFIPVSALIRHSLWDELGGFRSVAYEDFDLWRRALGAGARFRCVPEVLWTYRINVAGGTSRNPEWGKAA